MQGIRNLHARLRQQGTDQMEGAGLLFTARWHYSVPPHVQGPVFALERDQNSGEAREAGVRVNQWDISASPEHINSAWAGGGSRQGSECLAWSWAGTQHVEIKHCTMFPRPDIRWPR